ncbi:MAG: dihydrodipicolinate reductase [Paracoccus sp. (in: a-proteobacteria)]|nr:dihydrodipicolinate reductase [Paracoccus sp. (in: a-proteobacteria)]
MSQPVSRALPRLAAIALIALLPMAAAAERVTTRDDFVSLVDQRRLTTMGITLVVSPDGRIGGRAFGSDVSGDWVWDKGWFCRTLAWGSRSWPRNCQLVVRDGDKLRFTSDQGTGDSATLRIR